VPAWVWPAGLGALGLVGAAGLRRQVRLSESPAVQVVSRQSLGDKNALLVVEVTDAGGERRRLLLGTGGGAPALVADLGEVPSPEIELPSAPAATASGSFLQQLESLLPKPAIAIPAALAGHADAQAAGAPRVTPSVIVANPTRATRFDDTDILDVDHPTRARSPRRGAYRGVAAFAAHAEAPSGTARVELDTVVSPSAAATGTASLAMPAAPPAATRTPAPFSPIAQSLPTRAAPPTMSATVVRTSATPVTATAPVAARTARRPARDASGARSIVDEVLAERMSEVAASTGRHAGQA
jgi:hypothetical protein